MSTQIHNVNRALLRCGVSKFVVAMTEDTEEAAAALELYDSTLRETLRAFPWPFATKYAKGNATVGASMQLIDGSAAAPANADWIFAWRYPTDGVFVRRVVGAEGRKYARNPPPFRVGRNSPLAVGDPTEDVMVVYTNVDLPLIEYTALVDLVLPTTDPLFEDVFQINLAAKFAMLLSRDADLARKLYLLFKDALPVSTRAAAAEQQQEAPGEAEWISARD